MSSFRISIPNMSFIILLMGSLKFCKYLQYTVNVHRGHSILAASLFKRRASGPSTGMLALITTGMLALQSFIGLPDTPSAPAGITSAQLNECGWLDTRSNTSYVFSVSSDTPTDTGSHRSPSLTGDKSMPSNVTRLPRPGDSM